MSKDSNNGNDRSEQMQEQWRLAIAYMRAILADDVTLAGEILMQFESHTHALQALTILSGYVFSRVEGIDERLEQLSFEAATESGDWPVL